MPTTLLAGKRLLITGVVNTDSIAFATAVAALDGGAEILLSSLGRDLDAARRAAAELPGEVPIVEADLTSPDDLQRLASHVAYDDRPLDEPDEWGDLASFRVAASAS